MANDGLASIQTRDTYIMQYSFRLFLNTATDRTYMSAAFILKLYLTVRLCRLMSLLTGICMIEFYCVFCEIQLYLRMPRDPCDSTFRKYLLHVPFYPSLLSTSLFIQSGKVKGKSVTRPLPTRRRRALNCDA